MINSAEMVKKNLKIALIGSYPPPYGGVSIHVQRLHYNLLENDIQSHVYNISSSVNGVEMVLNMKSISNWIKILFIKKDIYHVFTTSNHWLWLTLHYTLSRKMKSKLIITYLSLRYSLKDFNWFARRTLKIILRHASHCIAVNQDIKKRLESLGANPGRISVIPPFIPPINYGNNEEKLPNQINNFIKSHQPLISAYAYSLTTSSLNLHRIDTTDLYGIDLLVDLCFSLKKYYPKIGFVLSLTHLNDKSYYREITTKIINNDIKDNFFIYNKPIKDIYNLWSRCAIFIRPTLSDGDSVALREALWFNTPSIASNASPRPEGTILFKNSNLNDLIIKTKKVLENYSYYKSKTESLQKQYNFNKLLNIYDNCVQNDLGSR